jgi:hypothetical protein
MIILHIMAYITLYLMSLLYQMIKTSFLDESFFSTIKAKKKGYVAKIIWSDPGNTEPPHIDFFPSFIGKTKDDGTHWSLEELENNRKNIIRVWIPLKNSEVGHILFSTKDALVNWSAGDVFHLPSDTVHGFTNAGRTRRYVLSITAWRL